VLRVDRSSLGALAAGYTEAGASAKAVRIESSAAATATSADGGDPKLPVLVRSEKGRRGLVAFQQKKLRRKQAKRSE
jgi:hypothetical protein